ncbi:VanZ family protein [Bacillus thermotolerans]|uniref:VanZ family protein n=1 Tax=Bacillus thermotolerans TaxID=1221996 RepID=UPI00058913E1|nr:VanZ family protein [Bacillus thermotolerans]
MRIDFLLPAIVIIFLWLIFKGINIFFKKKKIDLKQEVTNLLFLVSILWIIGMTIFPIEIGIPNRYGPSNNFIPFSSISNLIDHFYFMVPLKNIAGNIILFVPFGFMLTLKFNKLNGLMAPVIAGIMSSTFIEIVQLLLPSRAFDIDDIILNTLGTMIGFFVLKATKVEQLFRN